MPSINRSDRFLRFVRRSLLTIFGVQLLLAMGMTLVDSYRRRGKKAKPFPVTPPQPVQIGQGTVTPYTYGADLYADMLEAIEDAQHEIFFETYIWKGDELGERFKVALTEAAERGVQVHIIYDSFANLVVSPRFKRFAPTLNVLPYPIYNAGLKFWELNRYGRDHRKILVVDSTVGFVGGYNIGAEYATEWRDTHVQITGPGVDDLRRAFVDMWNLNRKRLFAASLPEMTLDTASSVWDGRVRFSRNIPRLWMYPIRSMYIEAIKRSSKNIWLTQAYFLPDQDFVDALKEAARRGVDVRLMLPAKSNHIVADWISRGYFTQMLAAHIRIFRFRDAMVHAKTATIDGSWSTVGTANIDRLSLQGNFEINVEIIDEEFAREMEHIFGVDQSNCYELTIGEWASRDLHRKFTENVLAPLRPLL